MNPQAELFNCVVFCRNHNGRVVVWNLALWLRVAGGKMKSAASGKKEEEEGGGGRKRRNPHSNHSKVFPHGLQEIIKVPLVFGGDGNIVRNSTQQLQLLNRNRIDLIQHVDARSVHSASHQVGRDEGRRRKEGERKGDLLPSRTSINSSTLASHLNVISALETRYSLHTLTMTSLSS